MSSTESGPGVAAAQTYRERMISLLAGRNPMEVLELTRPLADIVARHSAAVLHAAV